MAEYDLVIRGGTVVDGTRLPAFKADVAVAQGRIARISGTIAGRGKRELDASGCIVAPGAVDLHTHYDAQLNWDPYCTLSGWHGVTTLTIGQCGFGFAPCRPEDRDLNMRMMNRIEAIPYDSMVKGMRWDWITFPEYLDSLERQGLGVNVASLFPYSPLRAWVLGARAARERTSVTAAELAQLRALFREGMAAGAFGFSADRNLIDRPEDGSFLPTQVASREEFLALAEVLREFALTDFFSGDEEVLAKLIAHPYTHISVSDGGAHTRFAVIATWPTHFLAHWVRDKGLMSLEDAHYKISALPAWIAGFRDRGLLREGFGADAIVYEPERLGFVYAEPVFADDFPGGERRIIQKARGYRYTIVNGTVTFEDGRCTGALPGELLRSGA